MSTIKQTKIILKCQACFGYGILPSPEGDTICPECKAEGEIVIDFTDLITYREAMINDANNYYLSDEYTSRCHDIVEGMDNIFNQLQLLQP